MTSEILDKLDNVEDESEDFETLFEEALDDYDYENPQRGQIISGEIIQIDDDSILVDIGAKRDAIVTRKDLDRLDDEMIEGLSAGDTLPVYVLRTAKIGGDLLVSIRRGLEQEDWERAQEMLDSGEATELEIIGQNKGGVVVRFGRLRGFVPNSHIPDLRRHGGRDELRDQKEDMIGDTLVVKVIEVNQRRRRLVLSSRAARQERRLLRLKELDPGATMEGKVVNLVDFGAFVDLGGVDGLIHISELDWSRVDHPSEILDIGDEVEVEITNVDVERERVSLSRKNLMKNPWDSIQEKYSPGDLVEGEITNVRNFGAFVMLPEGVEGLIHVSEIGIIGPGSPQDVVHPGDEVLARIIDMEPERERISLSLSRVSKDEQMAWLEKQGIAPEEAEEAAEEELPVADFDAELEAELGDRMPEDVKEVGESEEEADEEAEPAAEAEAEVEAEAEGAEAVAEVEAEEEAEEEAEPAAEAEAEVEAEAEGAEAVAEVEAEEEAEEEAEPAAEAEAEVEAEVEEVEAVAEVEAEEEAEEEAQPAAEAESEIEAAAEEETESEEDEEASEPVAEVEGEDEEEPED